MLKNFPKEYFPSTFFVTHIFLATLLALSAANSNASIVFINEFHYDNNGLDSAEGVEIAGLAGTSLDNWQLLFYNGNNGMIYKRKSLTGTIDNEGQGFGAISFLISGLQNGPSEGIALVDSHNTIIEFISYEGTLLAKGGAAIGLNSVDIGISQPSNLANGYSIQRNGQGTDSAHFSWSLDTASFDSINDYQQFSTTVPLPASLPLFFAGLCGIFLSKKQ